jgi:SpoVK/Ycf46/Vps4 family AAA+-type ATPase
MYKVMQELNTIITNSNVVNKPTQVTNVTNYLYQESDLIKNSDSDLLLELNKLTGLYQVKQEVRDIYSYVKNQKKRNEKGLKTKPLSYHMIFYGPPGTGKTTVARIVAKMFKELGILKKGHFIEADRSQLVGEYLGQTAPKVNQIVDKALDGILFIDEAYSLFSKQEDIFAKEAVNTLIKRIEDDRDRLIVIMAGYKEQMDIFIESNPGFKSRFNNHINFKNYNK